MVRRRTAAARFWGRVLTSVFHLEGHMTNNWKRQRSLHGSHHFRKNSAWNVAFGIVLFGVFVSAPIPAAVFTVNNNTLDIPDAKQGEGICNSVPPLNVCTLRTASGLLFSPRMAV